MVEKAPSNKAGSDDALGSLDARELAEVSEIELEEADELKGEGAGPEELNVEAADELNAEEA